MPVIYARVRDQYRARLIVTTTREGVGWAVKIYVVCDLEGIAGVVDFKQQCMADGAFYGQAIRMATRELNALVDGAMAGGATEVYAWPGHGAFPGGIDVELLHPKCRLVMHAGDAGPVGYDASFDAMFLLGLHAMAGTEGGVLAHSFTPILEHVWLNGAEIGEIAMNMLGFGAVGVPCVFVSGDQAAVDEARALVTGIEGAVVKWGLEEKETLGALSVRKAISLAPAQAQGTIRDAATRAMRTIDRVAPYRVDPPYTMRVQYIEEQYAEGMMQHAGMARIDETTVEQVRDRLTDLMF
jgi:D-amino peptidase